MTATDRFAALGIDGAPGQQAADQASAPTLVDFSHGDVDAFPPAPGAIEAFTEACRLGSERAYSRYRGHADLLAAVAAKVADFTMAPVDPERQAMITPGTQGALFLALSALVEPGDKVAVVEPDYFANRKIVAYLRGRPVPVALTFEEPSVPVALDLERLEDAARAGAKVLVFSNPNNPTGAVYPREQVEAIAAVAERYGIFVVVDQLYSRLIYPGRSMTHLRSSGIDPERCLTLMGPSKTESLSGFRTGVAVGPAPVLTRMEQVLAIHSLRTAGYNQAVLKAWFHEPAGWLDERIRRHREIRDDILVAFRTLDGVRVRPTEGGSYLFPALPPLTVSTSAFCELLRLEEGIVLTQGTEFGSRHPASVRLNFSQDRRRAVAAVEIIARRARRLLR